MSKLYIHIGTWKTGSSTIQFNLYKLRDELEKEGFVYLCKENKMVVNDGKIRGFTDLNKDYIQKSRQKFEAILDQKRQSDQTTFISSAEEFSGNPFDGFKNAKAVAHNLYEITKGFGLDISIIVYLRRQDDFFESLYQQSIRLGKSHTFDQFLEQFDSSDFDWYTLIESYADLFGKNKIIVRRYHKKYLPRKNSLIQSFGDVIGSKTVSDYQSTISKNRGFSRDTLEVTRMMNKYFEGEERFQLRKIFDQVNPKMAFDTYSFFSNHERKEFLARYRDSNHLTARKYLEEEHLFPDPDYSKTNSLYPGLSKEAIIVSFSKALLILKNDLEAENEYLSNRIDQNLLRLRLRRFVSRKLSKLPHLKSMLRNVLKK